MKQKVFWVAIVGAAFLAAALPLSPAEHYKVLNYPGNFYFGHVSYIEPGDGGEGPVILREGREVPEPAVLNFPVGPGDVVRTSPDRRLEIQFDTGTLVRLDFATEVKVETILARSLSSLDELSNLNLVAGRVYVMYKEYNRRETFQILTANAAVKMRHNSVSLISSAADGSTEVQVAVGRARVLFGEDTARLREQEVRKQERFIVRGNHQSQLASSIDGTDFELWNRDVNARFAELHEGLTPIPKPVQRMSPAVFYFAQNYGNLYGEWLWDDFLGYVWRPFIDNGRYPWGWQPYYYGQWAYSSAGMFWVPQEPWGWIPYHLGIWHWDKKKGWVWLPGSLFAPAWVDWAFYFGYAAWRPWGLYDWWGYGMSGFYYLDGNWSYEGPVPLRTITKDQLKKPTAAPFPVPKEIRSVLKNVQTALSKQDPRIMDSMKETPRHLVLVPKGDLNAREIHEKALSWDKVPKPTGVPPATSGPGAFRRFDNPGAEAARILRGVEAPPSLPQRSGKPEPRPAEAASSAAAPGTEGRPGPAVGQREGTPGRPEDSGTAPGPAMRFRDWNPDLKLARELGLRIEYSSPRNEVLCPELRLSSRDRSRGPGLRDAYYEASSGSGGSSGGASSSGSSGSSASSSSDRQSGRSSSGTERSAEKGTAKGGESGKIKN